VDSGSTEVHFVGMGFGARLEMKLIGERGMGSQRHLHGLNWVGSYGVPVRCLQLATTGLRAHISNLIQSRERILIMAVP
jgi:hypothetical protein